MTTEKSIANSGEVEMMEWVVEKKRQHLIQCSIPQPLKLIRASRAVGAATILDGFDHHCSRLPARLFIRPLALGVHIDLHVNTKTAIFAIIVFKVEFLLTMILDCCCPLCGHTGDVSC